MSFEYMSFEELIKGFILKLLNDEQIQQRLVSLSGEVQNVAQANKTGELKALKKKIFELEKVSQNQKNELATTRQNLQTAEEKIQELEKLLVFDEIDKVYQKYCSLPEEIQKSLDDLICRYSPVTFLLSGSANDNIPLLWGRIAKKVTEYSPEHIDILKEAFDLFFRCHSETYHTLERLHTEIGETYNVERHDRTPDSSPSGQIVQVLLEGYQNTKTGKITKTIVRL